MRTNPILGLLLAATGLLAAGCTSAEPRVAGSAGPVTAASTPVPAASPSAAPAKSTRVPSKATPKPLELGPDGIGALKLGMSRAQASATGLITAWRWLETGSGDSCYVAKLKGVKEGGVVIYRGGLGVGSIGAYAGLATPLGLHEGDSKAALLRAYPDWKNVDDNLDDGRGYAAVPGNSKAHYRIVAWEGKVRELSLEHKEHGCYE